VACAAAITALLAAGCGSSSPSQTQLRTQAATICAHADRVISRIATPAAGAGGEAFLRRGVSALKPELQQLRQLKPPDDAADVWSTATRTVSAQLSAIESTANQIRQGADTTLAYKSLQRTLAPLETQANNAWSALEIPACQNQ
jgi:outer membrane murein-binding lipoprotein Lpp